MLKFQTSPILLLTFCVTVADTENIASRPSIPTLLPKLFSLQSASQDRIARSPTEFFATKSALRLRGGDGNVGIAERQEMVKRARSFEIVRTKSFGELSTLEYEALVKHLSQAAETGNIQQCISLVKQVNALHTAAFNGHAELCRVLVELGADIHLPNPHGLTALHIASQLGHLEAVKVLLAMGADLEAEDAWGDTAIDKARLADHEEVARYLESVADGDQHSVLRAKHRWRREGVPTRAERSRFIAGHHENPMLENL